jgi:membrane protease YdiL (CAAX protease family)
LIARVVSAHDNARMSLGPLLKDIVAAQVLMFDRRERPTYDEAAGRRLLLLFVTVGLVLQPGLRVLARIAGIGDERWTPLVMIVVLIIAALVGVRRFVGLDFASIGLHPWRTWTRRERAYLLTVGPLAAVTFSVLFRDHFAHLAEIHGRAGFLLLTLPTGLLWGFVQELLYRGLLQTELVRRIGAIPGVLLANLVFTFGPLHFVNFGIGSTAGPNWVMFVAVFAIGLFFGTLYQRSGNLWIPAILHGMWPANMT